MRGESKKPLFVTSAGVDTDWAAAQIINMDGEYRLPTLVKLADSLSKEEV
jgi:deoxyribonuclease V